MVLRAVLLLALGLSGALAAEAPVEPAPFQASSQASPPDWLTRQYGYIANNESLRSLLYDFGTTVGVPLVVSDRINRIVDDRVPTMPAGDFLDHLHTEFQLIWVFDGTTLRLYDAAELRSKTFPMPFQQRGLFEQTLQATNVIGQPLKWTFLPPANLLQVSGPPQFVDLVEELAAHFGNAPAYGADSAAMGQSLADLDEDMAIRVFRVEYGHVDSAVGKATGVETPIVSLAEMIAKLMNVSHVSEVSSAPRGNVDTMPKLRGTGLIERDGESEPAETLLPTMPGGLRDSGKEAFVIADSRLNAILVRDRKHRMPTYERLIADLDVPVDQVEIRVSVLDIDATEAEQLQFTFETDDVLVRGNAGEGVDNLVYAQSQLDVEGVAVRLRALRDSTRSRILTQPSIVTLDNQEASFQNNRTFYVRLGGERAESVDLAPVSYGWVVRIRPHVIYSGGTSGERSIHLAVHLEEGARGAAALAVTGVPEVAQNIVQTQAIVQAGNSLLIGGYTIRQQSRFRQRIPYIGRIPILGRLFSSQNDRDQSLARYFLITPRILPAAIHNELDPGFDGAPVEPRMGQVQPP